METEKTEQQAELEKLKSELADSKKDLLYAQAEIATLRNRMAREVASASDVALKNAASAIVPVLNDIIRMTEFGTSGQTPEQMQSFVRICADKAVSAANNLGMSLAPGVGSGFDPNVHNAVHAEGDCSSGAVVTAVVDSGWLLKDKLLVAANVIVGPAS